MGWVPDWLVDDIHALRAQDADIEVLVERDNPDTPAHLRLLCRLSGQAATLLISSVFGVSVRWRTSRDRSAVA